MIAYQNYMKFEVFLCKLHLFLHEVATSKLFTFLFFWLPTSFPALLRANT